MSNVVYQDQVIEEMKIKNCSKRIVDLNEEFNDSTCYKIIYMLEKIVEADRIAGIKPKDAKEITLRINSYGGICYELWSIINVIERLKGFGYVINTVCMGKACSCGFILFCSGVNRYVGEYSTLMYHSVSSGCFGKLQELREDLAESDRLNTLARNYVIKQTGVSESKLIEVDKYKVDWFVGCEEAIELGIATDLY